MWISLLLAALSGTLYVFSFAPWDQAYLQWIAFVPLYFSMDLLPQKKQSLLYWFLLGLIPASIICLGGFYWMIYATQQYGGLPLSAAVSVFILFTLTGQLQVPLFTLLRSRFYSLGLENRSTFGFCLILGIFYAGIESLYPKLFLDTAGHAFYHSLYIRQAADIGGPFFLTVLVILVNELIYLGLRARTVKPLLYAGVTLILILGYGRMRVSEYHQQAQANASGPALNVALIQANVGDYLKIASERGALDATDQVMTQYLRLSDSALSHQPAPDALVWPETAYPSIYRKPKTHLEERMDQRLNSLLLNLKGSLLFGGYDSDESGLEYNSLFFVNQAKNTNEVYHKSILLMFGETLPFADDFPAMKSWFPTMGFFGRGAGPSIYSVTNRSGEKFQFAPSICYEGLFTDHSVQGALLGADALLNITNDSWFGPLGEPYLHLALTQFRSIETRLPLLRSTNTGISVAIDPIGETLSSTGVMTEAVLHATIRRREMAESPYLVMAKVFGPNWFVRLCQGLTLIFLGSQMLKRYRGKRSDQDILP